MSIEEIKIVEIGHRGDGIGYIGSNSIYVSGALPRETVRAKVSKGRALDPVIVSKSSERIDPICRHYGTCGGCSMQHLETSAYLSWKRKLVEDAFKDRSIEVDVDTTVAATSAGRRRAVFAATRAGRLTLLGFHEKASNRLVDITECPVLDPLIVKALPGLKSIVSEILPKKGELRLTVLVTTAGLDVSVEKADKSFERKIPALSQLVIDQQIARLTINGETLIEVRPPLLDMDGTAAIVAPGGFTQATRQAEEILSELVLEGIGNAKNVADLFSGVGTFALRIGKSANVHAVEGDSAALLAFDKATRQAKGLKKITSERRDLFRRPLVSFELEPFDAVVFDPPRAGAQAQAEQLAQSDVKSIIAVSCNPATLARDARTLLDSGYKLQKVTPVDQFLYSSHIEVVAILKRD